MRETIIVALVGLVSEAFVPSLVQFITERHAAARAEAAAVEKDEAEPAEESAERPESEDAAADDATKGEDGALERLQEDNRLLKELVGEKELALRRAQRD